MGSRGRRLTEFAAINLRNCPMDKETAPVTVVAFRAESHSPDGKNLIISLRTKYSSAERKYSVPVECLKDFLIDLQRLQASKLEHPVENLDQDVGAHQDIDSNKSGE
jgi:hypothetical protein